MNKRIYIYQVTGKLRVKAKSDQQARMMAAQALAGLEWTLDDPKAQLDGDGQPHGPEIEAFKPFYYEI